MYGTRGAQMRVVLLLPLVVLALTALSCTGNEPAPKPQTPSQADREALAALYHTTDGPNWRDNTNWLSDAPLDEWHGVFDDSTDSVIILSLNHNQLSGEIPPELGNLVKLIGLDHYENQLSGCVPSSLQGQLDGLDDLGGLPFC